jgi:outer membrane protein assembly factor BamB
VASDGTVYLASTDGNLYAVAPPSGGGTEGSVRWKFAFGDRPRIPTLPEQRGGEDGKGSNTSPAIGSDGTIYVGANNSNFYAVNPDGSLKWKYEAETELAGIWSSPALSANGRTVYFGANKGGVYAVNAADGKLAWQAPLFGGSVYDSPMLDKNGTLYIGTTTGHVFALDSATGQQLSVADVGTAVWSTPSLRPDGSLVAADVKGNVLVFGA